MERYLYIELTYLIFWPALFCFGLKLFRFRLKPYAPHILFSALLLSQISFLLQSTMLMYVMSIMHFLALCIALWLIFRIQIQYAFIMGLFSFIIEAITEFTVNWLFPSTFIAEVTEENMIGFFRSGIFICGIPFAYAAILHWTRFGFTFIPQSKQPRHIHFVGGVWGKIMVAVAFMAVFVGSIFFFFYPQALVFQSLVLLILLAVLFRRSYRWEMGE